MYMFGVVGKKIEEIRNKICGHPIYMQNEIIPASLAGLLFSL